MYISLTTSVGNIGGLVSELEGKSYVVMSINSNQKISFRFKIPDGTTMDTAVSDVQTAVSNASLTMYGYEVIE